MRRSTTTTTTNNRLATAGSIEHSHSYTAIVQQPTQLGLAHLPLPQATTRSQGFRGLPLLEVATDIAAGNIAPITLDIAVAEPDLPIITVHSIAAARKPTTAKVVLRLLVLLLYLMEYWMSYNYKKKLKMLQSSYSSLYLIGFFYTYLHSCCSLRQVASYMRHVTTQSIALHCKQAKGFQSISLRHSHHSQVSLNLALLRLLSGLPLTFLTDCKLQYHYHMDFCYNHMLRHHLLVMIGKDTINS